MTDGISVFVYRIAVNATTRNFPPRRTPDGCTFRPSLPIDLNVMITPWAESAQRHHRLLGWLMRMLEDIGTLTASQLSHYIAETDTFAPDEALEIVCEPLALSDYFTIWSWPRTLPTSATYVLRMLMTPQPSDENVKRLARPASAFSGVLFCSTEWSTASNRASNSFRRTGSRCAPASRFRYRTRKYWKRLSKVTGSAQQPGRRPLAGAKQGETLQSLAPKGGKTDWQSIAAADGIKDPLRLAPGQLIDLGYRHLGRDQWRGRREHRRRFRHRMMESGNASHH
jgi:hypothetical protein